jgi:predicted RNase H-like HicB family nuclease
MNEYLVIVEPSTTGWGAWSPDLNVYAAAATEEATMELIRDAIAFHIEGLREAGRPIPQPLTHSTLVAG